MKIFVIYDSESGHTEALAQAVAEGARQAEGADVVLKHVREAEVSDLAEADALIWGCPGHFGTISSGLKQWIDKLGHVWMTGQLVGKVGAAFCTTATVHGGAEMTLWNLITPMLHNGMIIVGLPSNLPENALVGSYYGAAVTCPVELEESTVPRQLISDNDRALGRALGARVAEVAKKLK
ncbi:NAD(P)H-dependent oxidoreductase [Laceyella putida]|uniref:NAD(P)H-dependent oxidoreductase n=1 Tax=Laceyella putida TaxID=110101 RepID=A0ABW2RGW0_9BACL